MPKEPIVTAESNLAVRKPRKPRETKSKAMNVEQVLYAAYALDFDERVELVKELKRNVTSEAEALQQQAEQASEKISGLS